MKAVPFIKKSTLLKKVFSTLVTGVCLLAVTGKAWAQADIHFSQFYEESILRNPALTGVFASDYKVGVYYRNQWSSITNPYSTTLASAESRVPMSKTSNDFLSFGLLGYSDKAGSIDQSIIAFYPALNYNKSLNPDHNRYLSVGFTGGYVQYSFDPSKATFNNQYVNNSFSYINPTGENLPNPKMNMWDLGAGINYNTSTGEYNKATYVFGASVYHITQPKFSYYSNVNNIDENVRINVNAAASYQLSDPVVLQVNANFAKEGTYQEIMAGGMLNWTQSTDGPKTVLVLSLGCYYRVNDAIIPVVKMKYKDLAAAVSYDVNVSTLTEASNMQGGYEFTLFYSGDFTNKNEALKKTVCPKF